MQRGGSSTGADVTARSFEVVPDASPLIYGNSSNPSIRTLLEPILEPFSVYHFSCLSLPISTSCRISLDAFPVSNDYLSGTPVKGTYNSSEGYSVPSSISNFNFDSYSSLKVPAITLEPPSRNLLTSSTDLSETRSAIEFLRSLLDVTSFMITFIIRRDAQITTQFRAKVAPAASPA
ncbi:hypothetical protein EVAR_79626_1 [Eumeta japonica]|uniref:Uncharacterized protein n=1 Tax=Eumeta variegata TaxID=151549 RepID=A0A4C1UEL6_EUMVA|nr:hypothetical protein EVAR_79626_1 [Eumeta japonica]